MLVESGCTSWWAENISSRLGSCDTITGSFDVKQHALFAIWCTKDDYAEPYEDEHRSENNPDKIKKKQEDYKAEVKIYQAVENLKGQNTVAIHSLKCTHFQ